VEFILDETGSMTKHKTATVNGFNDFLNEQKAQQGTCLLTLTKFHTGIGQTSPYVDLDIGMVPSMKYDWFVPGDSTNLRDTVGQRLAALRERLSTWSVKPKVLFVIMTDGGDNASRQYSVKDLNLAITQAIQEDGHNFMFLGADQDATAVGLSFGIPAGNIKSFSSSEFRETMQTVSAATSAFRASSSYTDADLFKTAI
jgi:hypothetical protein